MTRINGLKLSIVFGVLLVAVSPAQAAFQLVLSDGTDSVTINSDNTCAETTIGDCAGASVLPGQAIFVGSLGTGVFTTNVTAGITKPITNAIPPLLMDLNSLNVASSGAGTLTITWSDQGWNWPGGFILDASSQVTVPLGATVTYSAYIDDGRVDGTADELSEQETLLGSLVFTSTDSGTLTSAVLPQAGTYSLTQRLVLEFNGPGSISGDYALISVSEPASLALLGGVLLVMCAALKRKFRRAA
jgi:hypothetical protein